CCIPLRLSKVTSEHSTITPIRPIVSAHIKRTNQCIQGGFSMPRISLQREALAGVCALLLLVLAAGVLATQPAKAQYPGTAQASAPPPANGQQSAGSRIHVSGPAGSTAAKAPPPSAPHV